MDPEPDPAEFHITNGRIIKGQSLEIICNLDQNVQPLIQDY